VFSRVFSIGWRRVSLKNPSSDFEAGSAARQAFPFDLLS
jgi:hypothetical protein